MLYKLTNLKENYTGFTIVELMIATAVFGVILLLITFSMLQIGRTYYKGIALTQTQVTARGVIDDITQALQFSGEEITTGGTAPTFWFCTESKRYTYVLDVQHIDNTHAMVWDNNVGLCGTEININSPGNYTELLRPRMRIAAFEICSPGDTGCINPVPSEANLYSVTVRIVYGDDDLLTPDHQNCLEGPGSQFCAVSELTTIVEKRI